MNNISCTCNLEAALERIYVKQEQTLHTISAVISTVLALPLMMTVAFVREPGIEVLMTRY